MTKHPKLKKTLVSTAIVLLFALIYLYLGLVLTPKDSSSRGGTNFYRATAIKTEPDNSLDILLMGHSNVYSALYPIQIFKDTGYTSYNLGVSKQNLNGVKKQLRSILPKQKAKLVILDADCFFASNENRTDWTRASIFIAPYDYHVRWKELKAKDFFRFPRYSTDEGKGYKFHDTIVKYSKPKNFMKDNINGVADIRREVVNDIKVVKSMCDKIGASFMFICVPSPETWSNARHNAVQKIADQLKVPFVDMNQEGAIELNYNKCFRDYGHHLNIYGAQICSKYLSNYLLENYNFEDKRANSNYRQWDELVSKYSSILI